MKVFREQGSNIIDFNVSAVFIQMNSDKEVFVFVLNVHNDILSFCFIPIRNTAGGSDIAAAGKIMK